MPKFLNSLFCTLFGLACLVTQCQSQPGTYACSAGIYQCHLSPWSAWTACSESCGGGTSYSYKPICCPPSYKDMDSCAKDCNMVTSQYYRTRTCGQTCTRGVFTNNACQCPDGFHGKCCEKVGPAPLNTDLNVASGDDNTNCFKDKGVTTVMVIMLLLVAGGVTVDSILGYWIYKLKKQIGGSGSGLLTNGGVAPAATKILK